MSMSIRTKFLTMLTKQDIALLQKKGVLNTHDLKEFSGRSKTDIYVDKKGDLYTVPKGGKYGDPTYQNITGSGVKGF
jgi:hypothetical protein